MPIPQPKPETKWAKYAKEKGITTKKRDRMVFDESKQEYAPRWGYKVLHWFRFQLVRQSSSLGLGLSWIYRFAICAHPVKLIPLPRACLPASFADQRSKGENDSWAIPIKAGMDPMADHFAVGRADKKARVKKNQEQQRKNTVRPACVI